MWANNSNHQIQYKVLPAITDSAVYIVMREIESQVDFIMMLGLEGKYFREDLGIYEF